MPPAGRAVLPSAWRSRSRLVRSDVSGVRSSWLASATSRRCRSREAPSASSIWLNAVASRATSSSPSTRRGVEVLGLGDPLDRVGEAAYGSQSVAGHEPPREHRGQHAERAEDEQDAAELAQRAVGLGQGLREDQRLAAPGADGRDAVALALLGHERAHDRLALPGDDGVLRRAQRERRDGRAGHPAALGVDQDDPHVRGAEHPQRARRRPRSRTGWCRWWPCGRG